MAGLVNDVCSFNITNANSPVSIATNDGVILLTVKCITTTNGTIQGMSQFKGLTSAPVTLGQGDSISVTATQGSVLNNITITAPDGCTLQCMVVV